MSDVNIVKYTRDMQIARKMGDILCQADILARGWTRKQIAEFLPQPTLVKNPMYPRSAQPMKLWHRDDVEDGESEMKLYARLGI